MARRVLTALVFLAVYLGLAAGALAIGDYSAGEFLLWPASGLLIALLLHARRAVWPVVLALAALGGAIASLWHGAGPMLVAAMAAAQVAEGFVAARLLQRRKHPGSDLLIEWLGDAAAIAIAAPLAGGLLLAAPLMLANGAVPIQPFADYVLAHAVGNLVFFPLFSMILSGDLREWVLRKHAGSRLELAVSLAAVAMTGAWALSQANFLPLLVPILIALIATCRFGMPAASLAVVVLAVAVWTMHAAGAEPRLALADALGSDLQFLQFYLVLAVVCLQPLARHLTQNRRLALALSQRDRADDEVELSLRAKDYAISESQSLYRLLADNMTDVILRTDRDGVVIYASPSLESRAGVHPAQLVGRSILELIHPSYGESFKSELEERIAHGTDSGWAEYLGVSGDGEERWFDTQIRCVSELPGNAGGAVVILRNIAERKALEQQLFAAVLTDPLTNLTNRRAFNGMLQHHLDTAVGGCLAIFDIDDFRSINRDYGFEAGDKVLTTVAKMLRALLRKDDIISRIGGERFAVLLSQATPDEAEMLCQRVVRTIAEANGPGPRITVSAGVSRIEGTLDDTMKRADAAVVLAKAKGRNRLEMEAKMGRRWTPDQIPFIDEK